MRLRRLRGAGTGNNFLGAMEKRHGNAESGNEQLWAIRSRRSQFFCWLLWLDEDVPCMWHRVACTIVPFAFALIFVRIGNKRFIRAWCSRVLLIRMIWYRRALRHQFRHQQTDQGV